MYPPKLRRSSPGKDFEWKKRRNLFHPSPLRPSVRPQRNRALCNIKVSLIHGHCVFISIGDFASDFVFAPTLARAESILAEVRNDLVIFVDNPRLGARPRLLFAIG